MDWVKTALSVGTTIGKIAGMLQGNDGGLIHFGPTGSGVNPAIGQTGFFLDKNGQCWVGNQGTEGKEWLRVKGGAVVAGNPAQ
ncbi:hypothetical protein, partial [Streptosporangium sp. NPDC003464]